MHDMIHMGLRKKITRKQIIQILEGAFGEYLEMVEKTDGYYETDAIEGRFYDSDDEGTIYCVSRMKTLLDEIMDYMPEILLAVREYPHGRK